MDSVKKQNANSRNYNLEILRIISCFGIVLSHGNDAMWAREFGNMSLVNFVLISFYFLSSQKNYSSFFLKRVDRLLIPWIFWFFVYGLLHVINGMSFLYVEGDIFSAILNGTRMHLWYLPFIFITSIIIVFYYNIVEQRSIFKKYNLVFFMLLSIIFLLSMPLWRPWSLVLGVPWGNWFIVFPALFIGASLTNLNHHSSNYWKIILYVIIIILISTWLTLSGQWLGIPYLFGILLFVTAVYLKFDITRHSTIIMKLSNCTYGIYLIHPLIGTIGDKLGFSENLSPYLTYALSLLIIIIANKIPGPFIKKII
jgi:hypothetical protein